MRPEGAAVRGRCSRRWRARRTWGEGGEELLPLPLPPPLLLFFKQIEFLSFRL